MIIRHANDHSPIAAGLTPSLARGLFIVILVTTFSLIVLLVTFNGSPSE